MPARLTGGAGLRHLAYVHDGALEVVGVEGVVADAMTIVVDGLGGVVEEVGYLGDVGHAETDKGEDALLGAEDAAGGRIAMGLGKQGVEVVDEGGVEGKEGLVELLEDGVEVARMGTGGLGKQVVVLAGLEFAVDGLAELFELVGVG